MRCKVCGTEVKENQRFCPTCGLLIDLSFSPFQNIEVQPEPEKDEEPEFLKQQMLAQEEAETQDENLGLLPIKTNVGDFPEDQKEVEEMEDIMESSEKEEDPEYSSENVEDADNVENAENVENTDNIENVENTEKADSEEKKEISDIRSAIVEEQEDFSLEEHTQEESSSEELEQVELQEEDAKQESLLPDEQEQAAFQALKDFPQEEPKQDELQQENSEQEEYARENSEEEKSQQGELKVEEGPDMEEESITVIERDFFKDKTSLDAKGEPEEKILSLQEKRKEMEEKLAFEGEIPDDPDDFQEKAAIPPTSVGEWKKGWQKWKKAAPLAIIPVLGIAYLCYQNLPATQYDNLLKKGTKLVQEEKGEEAIVLLEGMPSNLTKNSKYYLLLSEAYGKAGRHEEAVKALEEAKKLYPEDIEVQTALSLLDPKVESDLQGDSFTEPVEISLKSNGKKIIYSLSGGKEDIQKEEYLAPIKLSRNGNYTLTAYAQAADGSMGESYSKSFSISLDPEKYHLSQFVEEDGGRAYIDENGDRVTGWKEIAGKYYYFDENGIMQSGFQDIGGERYYLNADGTMQTGRLDLEGKTYFFDQEGHMIKDAWVDNLYYVGEDGVMLRNQENKEGVHFDEDGRRAFLAADLYAAHPDSIVVVESKKRKEQSSYYLFPAKVYYQKKNGRASGKVAYETEIKVSKMAMMSYLDENLPSITAKDAVSFLPTLSMQNIKQNKDGVVTSFAFVLGERRS